jgi:hypothetical protein
MTVYTVKGGQRKGSKHVINFPQNMSRLANILPQLPTDIPLIVRRSNIHETRHYDFRVRQHKVRAALEWLKANNKWYRDINISEERLSQLPTNANLEDRFWRQMADDPIGIQVPPANNEQDVDVDGVMGTSDTKLGFNFQNTRRIL